MMNTVGKKGKLGEQVRCVVSVSMLTEGWDANTVTHVLGVRAFRSPAALRAGRRPRTAPTVVRRQRADGYFEPEYANVYGIPFQFISVDKPIKDPLPPKPVHQVARRRRPRRSPNHVPEARRLPGRAARRGYLARSRDGTASSRSVRTPCPAGSRWVASSAAGTRAGDDPTTYRPQEVAFALAKRILDETVQHRRRQASLAVSRSSSQMCQDWIEQKVVSWPSGYSLGYLMTITEAQV